MNIWAKRIVELEGKECPLKKISEETGLAVSSLSDIKNGRTKQPRGDAAMKLYELHQRLCAGAPA